MIVKYDWRTVRGTKYQPLKTWWAGWFLFGILPLYIRIESREYLR